MTCLKQRHGLDGTLLRETGLRWYGRQVLFGTHRRDTYYVLIMASYYVHEKFVQGGFGELAISTMNNSTYARCR